MSNVNAQNFIGTADVNNGAQSYQKSNYFKLESGENLFRILPPLFSLAQKGQWAQYYGVHYVRNSENKVMTFQCIEEKDFKTKTIRRHCPLCDLATQNEARYKMLKEQAKTDPKITEERLSAYFKTEVLPFKADRKVYLNALDVNGTIGILKVPSRLFGSMKELVGRLKDQGQDALGLKGLYLSIRKSQAFKGDINTTYSVDVARVQDPNDPESFRVKRHELTPELINQLFTTAKDLSTLYRSLTDSDIARIAAAPNDTERRKVVDEMFPRSERQESAAQPADTILQAIPGTNGAGVVKGSLTPEGFSVQSPFGNGNVSSAVPAPGQKTVVTSAVPAPGQTVVTTPVAPTISDDDFDALMGM